MLTKLPEEVAIKIIFQLLSALAYLHGRKISHGNINLETLVVDMDNSIFLELKMINFGLPKIKLNNLGELPLLILSNLKK